MIRKMLILVPNTRWFDRRYFHSTPYTPCLLAAIVNESVDVEILDTNFENLTPNQVQDRIKDLRPDLVGITCMSMEYAKAAHKLADIVKSVDQQILTVLGGIYPTLLPDIALKFDAVDFVIIGEAEVRFPELIRRLNEHQSLEKGFEGIGYRHEGRVRIVDRDTYIEHLDAVPFPDYTKVNTRNYFQTYNKGSITSLPKAIPYADTITSRGCPFRCVFCSSRAINGRKIHYRSAENVLMEIDWLVEQYSIRHITFNDDNFFLDKGRVMKIMQGLVDRNYGLSWKTVNAAVYALDEDILEMIKKSGGYQLFLAVESGNQDVLKHIIHKPLNLEKVGKVVNICKKLGLQTTGIFMIGLPGETWDQIRETFRYAERMNFDCTMFNIATPLPCTEMYDIAKKKGYLDQDADFENLEFFGFGKGTMTTEEFTPFELQVLRSFEWDRINFSSEQKKKINSEMLGISLEELDRLRKETRRRLGIHSVFNESVS